MSTHRSYTIDTVGLSAEGVWVRRIRCPRSLTEEALSLAQVLQMWNLSNSMCIDEYHSAYVEVSGPELQPRWVYLVELIGRRTDEEPVFPSHPLSEAEVDQEVRLVAMVQPPDYLVPGALIETANQRRMVWMTECLSM